MWMLAATSRAGGVVFRLQKLSGLQPNLSLFWRFGSHEEEVMVSQIVNGVPVENVRTLVSAVQDDPANGATKWSATTTWKGGFNCESKIREHTIHMNEPDALGGTDTAPNMVETVLAAYGSCLTVGYTMNAALRGIEIRSLEVKLDGDLDLQGFLGLSDDVPAGFSSISAIVHLDADATPEQIEELHQHVLKTSQVGCILSRPLSITTELA
jgi:uncharacterized OsmC-like protein